MAKLGEGAISQGPMVPVFEGQDPAEADRALRRLDDAGIPALRADQVPGAFVGVVPAGVVLVVVPLGLLAEARAALRQTDLRPLPPPRLALPAPAVPRSSGPASGTEPSVSMGSAVPGPEVRPTAVVNVPLRPRPQIEEEELGPIERPPYEGASGQTRLTLALAGCAVGTLLQAGLLLNGGFARILRSVALSWDGAQFHGNVVMAGFVHASTVHFLGNLAFGLLLGSVLIGTHGLGATAAVWLFSSMLGITAEAMLSPGSAVLGASAGIYGLVGLWLRGELQRARRSVLPRRAYLRALGVILLLAPGAMTPFTSSGGRVAVLAHLVGFAVGLVAGRVFPRWHSPADRVAGARRGRWALAVSGMVTIGGLVATFLAVTQKSL